MKIDADKVLKRLQSQPPIRKPRTLTPEVKGRLEKFAKTQYLNYVKNIQAHLDAATEEDADLSNYLTAMKRDMAMGIVRHSFEYVAKTKTYNIWLYVGVRKFEWSITAYKLRNQYGN